jgi:hypothetical protein
MDTQNPVEEGILKLIEKGYNSTDVYNIMTQIGWQSDEVQLSMNELYERRAKESEELAKQRRDAIEQINASYQDLKKKAEPVQSDAFIGTFPGERSLTLDALDDIDAQVLNNASRSSALQSVNGSASSVMSQIDQLNDLKAILSSEQSSSEERRDAEKRIPRLEQSIQSQYDDLRDVFAQTSAMGVDMDWDIELDLEEDKINTDQFRNLIVQSHMRNRDELDALSGLSQVAQNTYKDYMGVDFPDIESIGDLQNEMTAMALQRAMDSLNREQEELGDVFEGYDLDEYAKAVEDQTWLSSTGRGTVNMIEAMWSGAMMEGIDVGDFLRENPSVAAAARLIPGVASLADISTGLSAIAGGVEDVTGFDSRLQLQHYFARQKEQDRIRKAAREKELYEDPSYWNLGASERYEKINQDVEAGKLDMIQAAGMYGKVTGNFMEEIVPSALYFGAMSMAGPAGIAGLALSVSGQKYGDMLMERPDLNLGERLLIANTVGVAEAGLAYVFKGAEKALVAPFMKMLPGAAIKQMGKESAKNALKISLPKSLKALKPGFGESLEEIGAYMIELGIENAVDRAAGRKTRDFNIYEFSDAAIGGFLGGAGMQGAGYLVKSAANRGHHETRNRKLYLQGAINELRREIANSSNAVEKQELRKNLYALNKEYRDLSAQETLTYGKYSVEDRSKIMKLNREIAFLEDQIKYKVDSAGIKLNKDQIEALETRLKGAMDAKVATESKYDSLEKTASQHSKPETAQVADVENNDSPVESKQVPQKETQEQHQDAKQPEMSDPVRQEGEQLSAFNEKDFATEEEKQEPVQEEAPVEETTVEEAPVEEAPVEESPKQEKDIYSTDNEVDTEKGFDLADRSRVGDDAGQVNIASASAFNKALKGFKKLVQKAGTKIYVASRADFDAIAEARNPERFREIKIAGNRIGGYYDTQNNAIVLPSDARISSIQEEFGHAFMLPIINGQANPALQQELFDLLMNDVETRLSGKALSKFQSWKESRNKKYKDQTTPRYREEMILGFFKYYKENVGDFKGLGGRIRQILNTILKKAGHQGELPFRTDNQLLKFAENYAQMTEGVETDIEVTQEDFQKAQKRAKARIKKEDLNKREDESEDEYRARLEAMVTELTEMATPEDVAKKEAQDLQQDEEAEPPSIDDLYSIEGRKKFTYLQDTEVFYEDFPYVNVGDIRTGMPRMKKAKFKDYFHFRNWYTHMTANHTRERIGKMYFIKDGKKYDVKPPKPKVDSNGKPVFVKGAPSEKIKYIDRQWDKRDAQVRKLKAARSVWFDFVGDAYEAMKKAGVDGANGAAFVPGFDYDAYSQLKTQEEKEAFRTKFTTDLLAKTPEEITELSDIARKNLDYLKNNGMSAEEMASVDKASLFNSLGLKKGSETVDGDIMDGGDLMYSIESKDDADVMKFNDRQGPVERFRTKLAERGIALPQLVRISDYNGARAIVIGYDPSFMNIETGVQNQVGQKVDGQPVYTSHRDRAMAQRVLKSLKEQALADSKKPKSKRKGYVVVLTGTLSKDSLLGNPTVYTKAWEQALGGLEGEARVEKVNEIISNLPASSLKGILKQPGIEIVYSENSSLADKIDDYLSNPSSRATFPKLEESEVNEFIKLTSFVNANDTHFSFDYRNVLTKRVLKAGGVTDNMTTEAVEWAEKNFFDEALEEFDLGTIVAATKIPYVIKDGQVKGMKIKSTGGAFGAAIIRDSSVESLDESEGTQWLRTPVRVSKAIPNARKVLYEKKFGQKPKAARDPKTGKEKLTKAFRKGLNESQLRAEEADVLAKSRGRGDVKVSQQDDFLSIESDMIPQETDQGTFEMPVLSGFQRWRNLWVRRLVDKYNDIFDIQAAIEAQKGRLGKDMDFQMKEELMYGKAAQDLLNLDKKIEELKSVMKDEGVSLETLNDYLYALHAKERNRVIKERIEADNEQRAKQKKKLKPVTERGSGMSNEDADAILNAIKPSQKRGLEKLEKLVRDIQADTKDTMIKFGLESQETVDAWDQMFSQYVPLAGIATDEQSEATSSYPTGGAGLSVFGPMTKRAKGRKTQAENVLAQVIAQNAATHVKARTNEAIRSLYDLAKNNPNPDVWEVLDEANSLDPHVVSVRVDGEQKFIRFKDASHAQTLRNMNLPETNLFLKILRAPSNWLRRSFTTLNPEFVVSNFARDIQTAVFNAAAEAEIEGGILNGEKVMGDIIKTVPKTLKSLLRGQVGLEQDAEMKRYYEEFREDGAKTGWAYAKRLNEIAADLEKSASDTTRMQEILGKGKDAIDFVEGVNEVFEDATRLAAYVAARKNGVSREKAAQLAKNITVNFNKHGEWGQALNGVYLFFNASVQGTARMFKTIGTLKPVTRPDGSTREWYERVNTAQKMAAGLTLFSAMLSMINAGLSGEDEDDVLFYDKIPDYVKERNLILMNPRDGKTYYKIPLPYGFNIFSNIGTVAADVSRGGMPVGKGMHFLGQGLINAFSPISFGQSESLGKTLAKGGIPTVAKPFFDAWGFNETYFGGPVAAEQLPFGTKRPESSMSFRSPEAVKSWFSWLNEVTGGSDRVSGGVDMNPDRMWYVFEYFIGGAGNFVSRTGKTIKSVQGKFKDSDYDIAANDIPFVRIMYGEQSRYYDHGKYRDNETKVRQLFLERKDTRDWDNPRYDGIVKLDNMLKASEKRLKALRDQRRKARQIKDWTRRSVEVQRIMDQERKIIMEFNKMYNELRKD